MGAEGRRVMWASGWPFSPVRACLGRVGVGALAFLRSADIKTPEQGATILVLNTV